MRCRILTDNPAYAHGWEMGMLWCRMAGVKETEPSKEQRIEKTIHSINDEQVIVMAGVTGWRVVSIDRFEAGDDDYEHPWSDIVLERDNG